MPSPHHHLYVRDVEAALRQASLEFSGTADSVDPIAAGLAIATCLERVEEARKEFIRVREELRKTAARAVAYNFPKLRKHLRPCHVKRYEAQIKAGKPIDDICVGDDCFGG